VRGQVPCDELRACVGGASHRKPQSASRWNVQSNHGCTRLANELRSGTWQVRPVRQQEHAEELNGAVNHESLGSRRSNSFRRGNQDSRSMTASADTSKHVQQTRGSRTSFMLARMQRHVLWLLAAVFLRCQARYQNCSRDDRFSNGAARQSIVAYTTGPVAATIDFRTARQSHVCSRGILSQRRVFRRLLHDARKSLHGSPRLIVGQCLHVGF
jgi:hypothetical protein